MTKLLSGFNVVLYYSMFRMFQVDYVRGELNGELLEGIQRSCLYLVSGQCEDGVQLLSNGLTQARQCCTGNLCNPGQYMVWNEPNSTLQESFLPQVTDQVQIKIKAELSWNPYPLWNSAPTPSSPPVLQLEVHVIHLLWQFLIICYWSNSMTSVLL